MVIVKKSIKINAAVTAVVRERKPHSFDGFTTNGASLLAVIESMGTGYDPANTKIIKVQLIIILALISKLVNETKVAVDIEKQNLIDFNTQYDMMASITTDSAMAFRATEDILPAQVKICNNNAKKVRGTRIIPINKVVPVVIDPTMDSQDAELNSLRHNSVSFQTFGIRLGNFFTHIKYIDSVTIYATNEARLKSAAMLAYYDSLKLLMKTLEESIATTNSKRAERNEAFFNNTTGARFLFTQTKNAIASKEGLKGANYKKVKGLSFGNLIKKSLRTSTTNY